MPGHAKNHREATPYSYREATVKLRVAQLFPYSRTELHGCTQSFTLHVPSRAYPGTPATASHRRSACAPLGWSTSATNPIHSPAYRYPIRTNHRQNVPRRSLRGHRRDAAAPNVQTTSASNERHNARQVAVTSGQGEVFHERKRARKCSTDQGFRAGSLL